MTITSETLVAWGFEPGEWFAGAIEAAEAMRERGETDEVIIFGLHAIEPRELPSGAPVPAVGSDGPIYAAISERDALARGEPSIASLVARLAASVGAGDEPERVKALEAEVERLRVQVECLDTFGLETTLAARDETIRELLGVLAPIVAEAARLEPNGREETIGDSCQLWQCGSTEFTRTRITYGHLRRARAVFDRTAGTG